MEKNANLPPSDAAPSGQPDGPKKPTRSRRQSPYMQRRNAETRRALMEAALALFSVEPYRDVTIAKITSRAEVSVGTFYTFFKSKEDLIFQAAQDLMGRAGSFLTDVPASLDAGERIARVMHGAACVIEENPVLVGLFMTAVSFRPEVAEQLGSKHAQAALAFTESLVRQGQDEGAFRRDCDPHMVAELLQSCLGSPRWDGVNAADDPDYAAHVDAKVAFILRGLLAG